MGRNGNLPVTVGSVIDTGPVNVRGAIRARHARVVYNDGTLYVVYRAQGRIHRQTVGASEPVAPDTPNGYWRATSDTGQSISFTRRGCGG